MITSSFLILFPYLGGMYLSAGGVLGGLLSYAGGVQMDIATVGVTGVPFLVSASSILVPPEEVGPCDD